MQEPVKRYGPDQPDDNFFSNFLFKLLSYWPLFVFLLVLSLGGAWIYLRYKVPMYATTASLLIKDEEKGMGESSALESLDIFGSKKNVENEIKLIQSKTMAQEVVKNLHLYAPITIEGKFADRSAYDYSPVIIALKNPDSLRPADKIYFTIDMQKQRVIINGNAYPLDQWAASPYGTIKFVSTSHLQNYKQEKPSYFSLIPVKRAANNIVGRTKVTASNKQSTVIDLSIQDEVPTRGEDILNELIEVYNRAAILDKNTVASNTLRFVEDRLKFVVNELDSVEGQLQAFKSRNQITDISSQGQIFLQTVSANDQKISDISMQLAVLAQVEDYVRGKGTGGNIVPSTLGVSDPILSQLLEKLYILELEYEQTRKVVPENNPSVVTLVEGMNKIKPDILENIRNQRHSLEAGRSDLTATNNRYSSILKTIPEKERELLGISRQQSIKNNIYTFLLQKREEAALSYASTVADSRVVDKAESTEWPVSPNRSIIYLMAVAAAFFIGIGFITVREMFNQTIQCREDIEKYTSTPILGEVVYSKVKSPIVIAEGKRTLVAEQFRHLRTSLGYLDLNSKKKKVLITSTISGEGKSFVTTNLGISLALMGKKVVLMELDLRKPKLSEALGVSRSVGITNFLIDQKDPEEIIRSTSIKNLFVIPSGPIPPNPSELILNGKVQGLFTYLETQFDYILIDTTPVSPVTDASILSPLCDVTLYLVRHDYTPKVAIQKLEEQNKMKSLKNIIIVFNGIKERGSTKYGYGYGYAEEEKAEGAKKGLMKILS